MFFLVGIFLAVFLLLLLLLKKNKSEADIVLAIWLFLIMVNQLFNYLQVTGDLFNYPHLLGVDFPFPVLNGVFLFFYAMTVTGNNFKRKWFVGIHLLPALSLVILAIPFYMLSAEEKVFVFENDGKGFEWYVIYSNTLIPLSGFVYAVWTLLLIRGHRVKIQKNFSNTDKKELQWLMYLSLGLIVIWLVAIFFDNIVIYSAVALFVLFIGFFGINQLNIFNTFQDESPTASSPKTTQKKRKTNKSLIAPSKRYAKSGLNEEMASQIYTRLNEAMSKSTLYKNENLTLTELAKFLKVHPNHLSQVINESEGKNFYNYVNSIRIKEFIALASQPENKKYTMISLAYDVGFGTKSTFNKHFKANTGKTPTEFFDTTPVDS
ncbi:MAG: helix-turn-helix domain-containing protein [Flavobacteriaceae bacterium]